MKIALVRSNISFFSWWKMLFAVSFVSTVLGALAWMWTEKMDFGYSKMVGFFVGTIYFFLAYWNWWVWRPRRNASQFHRWLSGFMYVLYAGGYFWLAGVSFWARMSIQPWNLVVVGFLFISFIFFSALPILNRDLAEKLYMLHGTIDRKIIGCCGISLIGVAGVAGYWFQKMLEKDSWMIVVSILGPIIGLGMIQHQCFEIWQTRPWQKEDE